MSRHVARYRLADVVELFGDFVSSYIATLSRVLGTFAGRARARAPVCARGRARACACARARDRAPVHGTWNHRDRTCSSNEKA